ncbi:glycosyltransferase family 39 protein [Nocardia thailandica]
MPVVALVFAAVLVATASRYGPHRDELYFLAAGRRLDLGYPDQPPLVPFLARAAAAIDADSLLLLRAAAILAATAVVVCAGLLAREFGGGRVAEALAAAACAGAALLLAAGHLLGTTVFDLAAWTLICLLVVRLVRGADPRWWLAVGVVTGLGLQNKLLLAVPVAVLVVTLLLCGPRRVLRTRWFGAGVGVAVLIWTPYLWWQARHGFPQWEVGSAIAGGSSGTSDDRAGFVVLQAGLVGPLLLPVWLLGLWWLWRRPEFRAFALAYPLLFAGFLVAGGKAYYLGGMYPVLLAAAAVPIARWLGENRTRWAAAVSVLVVNAAGAAVLFLPILPAAALRDSPVLAVNYDAGETIGWPRLVAQVAAARPPGAAVLTANYGEAGAIERYGAEHGLPVPYSGHNAYWWWGPPPDSATTVLTVGIGRDRLTGLCGVLEPAGTLDNGLGIDNDEQGAPLFVCRDPVRPWSQVWPRLRTLG